MSGVARYPTVPDGAARSVAGPTEGFADVTTSTTAESFDLSAWAGRYVKIYCETQAHYFAFVATAATALNESAATSATAAVVDRLEAGGDGVQVVVPGSHPFLKYKAITGTGTIRVIRS